MDAEVIAKFINDYGLLFIFLITFLEYMNFPGIPGGLVFIVAGIWASNTSILNLISSLIVSVFASILGSLVLYYVGKLFGIRVVDKYFKKFPKYKVKFYKCVDKLIENQKKTLIITRFIPVIRTLISIPVGIIKINIVNFVLYSIIGISFWNGAWLFASYFGFYSIKLFIS